VFGAGSVPDALWPLAGDAGMDRATFDRALADAALQDWIVQRALDAESRWHIDATPSFVINGKLYTGAMSAREFAIILGR
jgi:predicted DsbA family dithiol-disulfide isomerase